MATQVVGPIVFHNPPIPINSSRLIDYYPEGIYLLKKTTPFGVEHYAVAIKGHDFLKEFGIPDKRTRVIHKTNNGIGWDWIETFEWQVVGQVPPSHTSDALWRMHLSLTFWQNYDLFQDNCEHFARFVTEGYKQSTQVQTFALLTGIAFGLGILLTNWNDSNEH